MIGSIIGIAMAAMLIAFVVFEQRRQSRWALLDQRLDRNTLRVRKLMSLITDLTAAVQANQAATARMLARLADSPDPAAAQALIDQLNATTKSIDDAMTPPAAPQIPVPTDTSPAAPTETAPA